MLKNIRHKNIIEIIERDGFISTEGIAETYGVSIATARRDLDELEEKGFLTRKYGGAELKNGMLLKHSTFFDRQQSSHKEKYDIAKAAVKLIPENAIIAMDAGSTVYELCLLLKDRSDLTIICSDIHSAECLISGNAENKVYFMGGFLTKDGSSTCDFAERLLSKIAGIDLFFLSGDCISITDGISSYDYGVSQLNRCYADKAKKTIALIDHTKFKSKGFYKICGLEEIDTLVIDKQVSGSVIKSIEDQNIKYIIA